MISFRLIIDDWLCIFFISLLCFADVPLLFDAVAFFAKDFRQLHFRLIDYFSRGTFSFSRCSHFRRFSDFENIFFLHFWCRWCDWSDNIDDYRWWHFDVIFFDVGPPMSHFSVDSFISTFSFRRREDDAGAVAAASFIDEISPCSWCFTIDDYRGWFYALFSADYFDIWCIDKYFVKITPEAISWNIS